MKRAAAAILWLVVCISMFSCGVVQQEDAPEAEQSTVHGAVAHNLTALYPLDLEYNSALIESDGNRASLVDITWEFAEKWKDEVERYYNLLESYYAPSNPEFSGLNEEEKELLRISQREWQTFCAATEELNYHLSWNHEPTGGTKIATNQFKLYRDRAIELIMKCEQLGIK